MINESDLVPRNFLLYRDERVMYVGRSQHGGFVIERDVRALKDKPRFENVWPYQLQPLKETNEIRI